MLTALLRRGLRGHFRTDGEPRKIDRSRLITAPVAFLVFICLAVVAANMMPAYSNGVRMGVLDGIASALDGEAKLTAPFQPAGPGSISSQTQPPETLPLNWMTETPDRLGRLVGLNRNTSMVIALLALLMFFSLLVNAFQLPFVPIERGLHKDAFNPQISNAALRGSLRPKVAGALGISAVYASVLVIGGLNLLTSDPGSDGVVVMGLAIHPYMLIGIGLMLLYPIRHGLSSRRFLLGLLSRRCANCYHMDTTSVVDRRYVRTDVTTTTHYRTTRYQDGSTSRRKTGESTSSHDVYDYTYECSNCGHRFGRRE